VEIILSQITYYEFSETKKRKGMSLNSSRPSTIFRTYGVNKGAKTLRINLENIIACGEKWDGGSELIGEKESSLRENRTKNEAFGRHGNTLLCKQRC
jgi:hypothetical protein